MQNENKGTHSKKTALKMTAFRSIKLFHNRVKSGAPRTSLRIIFSAANYSKQTFVLQLSVKVVALSDN